jgi:hypothetical protein
MTDNNISYLRIRPCDSDNEIYLSSRHKEGTSAFTLKNDTKVDFNSLLVKGFQTITSDLSIEASAWFITDETIGHKLTQYSKRLIYRYNGNKENALEVISRHKPGYVLVEDSEDIQFFKSINATTDFKVSIYANSIDIAQKAILKGVDDLFLRDWSKDQIIELQNTTNNNLYERTVLSPLLEINEARNILEKIEFTNYLQTRNVRGYKREVSTWYPGSGEPIPNLFNFSSETHSDYKSPKFDQILSNFDKANTLSEDDLLELFKTSGKHINEIAELADDLTRSVHGNKGNFC